MKKVVYILFISLGVFLSSCGEEFLERTPLTQISDPDFWKSETDLELYLNRLYGAFGGWNLTGAGGTPIPDNGTDLVIGAGNYIGTKNRIDGVINVPTSGGGWSWGNVRDINYFLENAERVTTGNLREHYIGEGHFFRAWYYFNLFQQFGALPILTKPLSHTDDALYSARASRTEVANFILNDLDIAASKMRSRTGVMQGRLNRDIALLFKSRVALYAGTWEKYHQGTPFAGSTNGQAFITQAATAAKAVIDNGMYSLTQGDPATVYYQLFNQIDYSNNHEVLFWRQYNQAEGIGNQMWNHPHASGYTREAVRMYLDIEGKPISLSNVYQGDHDLRVVTVNRDPRLAQTIMIPGDPVEITPAGNVTEFTVPRLIGQLCPTGYESQKFRRPEIDARIGEWSYEMGYIFFRYAEALINYAEARAELGQLTQGDVDMSINLLRRRVGMPDLILANIETDPAWPNYGHPVSPALHEVRRERAVELIAEGHRLNDLMRWRAHSLFMGPENRPKGTKYTDELKGVNANLRATPDDYLDPYATLITGPGAMEYGFDPTKHYLMPLPINELTLNPNLTQNPGWE